MTVYVLDFTRHSRKLSHVGIYIFADNPDYNRRLKIRTRAMVFKGKISECTKAYCFHLLKSKGGSLRSIAKECGMSPASVLRIKKTLCRPDRQATKSTNKAKKTGRKQRLSRRQRRRLLRCMKQMRQTGGPFTAKRLMQEAGISFQDASLRTVTRFLNKEGYFALQARKKGLLNERDMKKRLRFAKRVQQVFEESFWQNEIAFYLDGTSFTYKSNPMDQARAPRGRI